MSSMIILGYKIVYAVENKIEGTELLQELEEETKTLKETINKHTYELADKVTEMEKIQNNLIQRELDMIQIKKEIQLLTPN